MPVGGSRIGRAFDFNAVTGDSGIGGMAELSYRLGDFHGGLKALELFAYGDGGGAFRKRFSPGLPKEQWIAGTGTGFRFSVLGMFWSGEIGVPLRRVGDDREVRAFFSVARAF